MTMFEGQPTVQQACLRCGNIERASVCPTTCSRCGDEIGEWVEDTAAWVKELERRRRLAAEEALREA